MISLLKGMGDDFAAEKRVRTRRWEKTDTPEKLKQAEDKPAPGYDKDGNELDAPEFEYEEGDGWKLTGNVTVETDTTETNTAGADNTAANRAESDNND